MVDTRQWIWVAWAGDFSDEAIESGIDYGTATIVAYSVENVLDAHPSDVTWKCEYRGIPRRVSKQ